MTRLHVIFDLERDASSLSNTRVSVDELAELLEAEVERNDIEAANGAVVFTVRVAGIGRTAKDAAQSATLRKAGT